MIDIYTSFLHVLLYAYDMSFYLKNGMVKLRIGIGRGKKLHDKRESIKAADLKRIVARELRSR